MTAALEQQSFLQGEPDGAPKVHPRDRASRTCTNPPGLQRNCKSRPPVALLQARRHETDNPRVPARCSSDNHRPFLLQAQRGERLSLRLRERRLLNLLTLAIETVEFAGKAGSFGRVFLQKKPHAKISPADAT